jgi:hypothetical protein
MTELTGEATSSGMADPYAIPAAADIDPYNVVTPGYYNVVLLSSWTGYDPAIRARSSP